MCVHVRYHLQRRKKKHTPHNQAQQVGKKKITALEKISNMPIHTAKVCSSHFMVNQILALNGHFCSKHKFWPPSLKPPQYALYKSAIARHAHVFRVAPLNRNAFTCSIKLYLETKEQDMSIFLPKDIYATFVHCYKNFMVAEILV